MNAGLFVFSTVLVNGPIMSNAHIENGPGPACQDLISQSWECRLTHMFREGNFSADWLANHGLSLPLGLTIIVDPPDDLKSLLRNDVMGATTPRFCAL